MGARGPIGKRSEELMGHRSKEEKDAVTKAPGALEVPVPDPDDLWHPIAKRWYEALAASGQSRFYEPSDWAAAQYAAEAMSRSGLPRNSPKAKSAPSSASEATTNSSRRNFTWWPCRRPRRRRSRGPGPGGRYHRGCKSCRGPR